MEVKINLNDKVKVKLTDYGIMLLKKRHDELIKRLKIVVVKAIHLN